MDTFKHITVTAADEDEVIIAGVGAVEPTAPDAAIKPDAATGPDAAAEPDVSTEPDAAAEPDVSTELDASTEPDAAAPSAEGTDLGSEPMPEAAPGSDRIEASTTPVPSQTAPAKRKKARADNYRETTLEDLESQSMPLAQKIVIIAAVVCIIGALVYYFAVMR